MFLKCFPVAVQKCSNNINKQTSKCSPEINNKKALSGISLAVLQLRFCTSPSGHVGSIPGPHKLLGVAKKKKKIKQSSLCSSSFYLAFHEIIVSLKYSQLSLQIQSQMFTHSTSENSEHHHITLFHVFTDN